MFCAICAETLQVPLQVPTAEQFVRAPVCQKVKYYDIYLNHEINELFNYWTN